MAKHYPARLLKVKTPKKSEVFFIRSLIFCGVSVLLIFVYWFCDPEHIGVGILFYLLTIALFFKLSKMVLEWYHYWSPSVPHKPELTKNYTVDILTTFCPGEPKEMLIRTLKAMQQISYPHTSYLCDEADDAELKKVCRELGIVHVTRKEKINAKAGNINNALKQASGEICVILDPDHVPSPELLDRTLPYFEDEEIAYVQSVQGYYNQEESFIARGAAEQTYHFYGPMMMGMNTYGTVQAIGANCVFRRNALDSIGGHAPGLAEDMHTAMQLHAKGWKSIYIPEMLTRGLVPATLSSYYKQQLKWSRGTFELLFRTLPSLYSGLTWRQKLHYFTLPLYFLFGLVNLLDFAVPVVSLVFAIVPWEVNLMQFGLHYLPLCIISLIIRMYAQRWLLEDSERGFHIAGGILRNATWWVFLIGFIYSIFNIKVPYIPTPKEDEHNNYWSLSVPNIIVALVCFAAIVYGLSIDWNPYSIAMAVYAFTNAAILSFIVMISQQKLMGHILQKLKQVSITVQVSEVFKRASTYFSQVMYGSLRNAPVGLTMCAAIFYLSYTKVNEIKTIEEEEEKELGGFYAGIDNKNYLKHRAFALGTITARWNEDFPEQELKEFTAGKHIPVIQWQVTENIFRAVAEGEYNTYLDRCVKTIREHGEPVFISFAPCADTKRLQAEPHEFQRAWQYIYSYFNNLGVSNITWVWIPERYNSSDFYPGDLFVDWIGFSCLNYGNDDSDDDWKTFEELYEPFRANMSALKKPVMISELGSLNTPAQESWVRNALASMVNKYSEVNSVILFSGKKNFTLADNIIYEANFSLSKNTFNTLVNELDERFVPASLQTGKYISETKAPETKKKQFKGAPGSFTFHVDGKPFYIRGVAYNPAHDWRDGDVPLTRRQVEKDLRKIKAMGANTIRRYGTTIYDQNILTVAEEEEIKVLYGFWFDPKTDYYKDTNSVRRYIDEVEKTVAEYKDRKVILAWSVGNETWGLLKHNFAKPYLINVRRAYVKMIEELAKRIHNIDSARPVFTCMEHEEFQLAGELTAFHDGAASLDAIGINSYYKEQISKLNHLCWQFDSARPYIVSEFGPRGYWDPKYNQARDSVLIEETDEEKAAWYPFQWNYYVAAFKGYNLGGFAYCWQDRMEGSYTWFGLTDYKGRLKPAYHALREAWTNRTSITLPQYSISCTNKFESGHEYLFAATSKKPAPGVSYEWMLLKNDYLEKSKALQKTILENAVRIKIPDKKEACRLYLFVTDESGNVTTTNIPLYSYEKSH